jgi:UDPglucose--hexose-1-phosphate uridylyltransferase
MWEERWHPLREEWVIVAAHRQARPWSGAEVGVQTPRPPSFDPACYLCPGNARVSGAVNPRYAGTFVFDNDHPCVGVTAPRELATPPGIYRTRPATGIARVVCYSPRHDVTLAELDVASVDALLETWQEQMRELATHSDVSFVLIFENKGEFVGVSNPQTHCQIYETKFTFK